MGEQVKKRAVVVIHGMGNQSPMATLRPFVEAVWTSETAGLPSGSPNAHLTWSQHDRKSGDMELWRITTNAVNGVRTDFFELYWADMLEDTKLADVVWWLKRLVARWPWEIPRRAQHWQTLGLAAIVMAVLVGAVLAWGWAALLAVWGETWWPFDVGVWFAAGAVVLVELRAAIPASPIWLRVARAVAVLIGAVVVLALPFRTAVGDFLGSLPGAYVCLVGVGLVLWWLRRTIFIQIAGDAARYLTPAPSNIGARKRIRTAGLRLLKALHEDEAYDRIIIAGHSLGTVVGYDILSYYWADINDQIQHAPNSPALRAVEIAGDDLLKYPSAEMLKAQSAEELKARSAELRDAFRAAQGGYCDEVAVRSGGKWKISDFITMGSPLSHANVLMVDDREPLLASEERAIDASWVEAWWRGFDDAFPGDAKFAAMFRARAAQRALPLCPPITETEDHFTYVPKKDDPSLVVPHHAALFAATRWTNIYAPCRYVLLGDVVGGPVAPLFGPGVKDVALGAPDGGKFFAHTHYWDEGVRTAPHLVALRAALEF